MAIFFKDSPDYDGLGSAVKKLAVQLESLEQVGKSATIAAEALKLANYQPKTVHVHAYHKTVEGKVVMVDPYTKTIKSKTGEPAKAIKGTYMVPQGHHTGKGGYTVDYELNPGDKVYESPMGNLVQVPHEGDMKAFHATPKGQPHKPFSSGPSSFVKDQIQKGKLPLIAEHPLPKDEPSTGEKIDTGAVHVDVGGGVQVALGPGDAAYKNESTGSTYITVGGTPAIQYSLDGTPNEISSVVASSIQKWIDKTGDQNLIAKGNGSAGPQKDNPSSVTPDVVQDGNFVHPVSGAKVPLQPGDVLHNHKTSSLSYLVLHPEGANHKDGEGTFIGKNGKPMKASPIALKAQKTGNYKEQYTVPGDQPQVPSADGLSKEKKAQQELKDAAKIPAAPEPIGPEPQVTVNIGGVDVPLMPGQKAIQANWGGAVGIFNSDGKIQSLWNQNSGSQVEAGSVNTAAWEAFAKTANPEQILAENNPAAVVTPEPKAEEKVSAPAKPKAEPWNEITTVDEAEAAYIAVNARLHTIGNIDNLAAKRDDFDRDVATLMLAAKLKDLAPSEKSQYTKMRNRVALLVRLADFSEAVKAGNLSPELEAEFTDLDSKFTGKGISKAFGSYFPLYVPNFFDPIKKQYAQNKFKSTLPNLGFDLYSGSESDYQQFAASQGFKWAGGLDKDLGKAWAQIKLKDPSLDPGIPSYLSYFEDVAHSNVVLANAKIQAVSAMEKAKPAPKEQPVSTALADAAFAAVNKKKEAQLKNLYTGYWGGAQGDGNESYHLKKVDADSWKITYDDGSEQDLTSAEALHLIQTDSSLKPVSDAVLAYPTDGGDSYKAYSDKLTSIIQQANPDAHGLIDLKPGELNKSIKGLGGNYVGKMDQSVKQQWLQWHAAGFPTATYALEDEAVQKSTNTTVHVAADVNPGSPTSPQGKQNWQVLADKLDPEVHALLKNPNQSSSVDSLSDEQLNDLIDVVGLKPLMSPGVAQSATKEISYGQKFQAAHKFWQLHQKYLPEQSVKAAKPVVEASDDLPEWEKQLLGQQTPEAPAEPALPPAPAGVSDEDWALVVAVLKNQQTPDLKASFDELTADLSPNASASAFKVVFAKSDVSPEKLLTAPQDFIKLLAWTNSSSPYLSGLAQSSVDAVKAKKDSLQKAAFEALKQDLFVQPKMSKWSDTENGMSITVPPGAQVFKYQSWGDVKYAVISPELKDGYWLHPGGKKMALGASNAQALLSGHASYPKVFEAPDPLTFEKASAEIGTSVFDWETLEQAEKSEFDKFNLGYPTSMYNEADVVIALKKVAASSHPKITQNVDLLPPTVQKLALHSFQSGDKAVLDLIQWKLDSGHYAAVDNDEPTVVFPPDSLVGKALAQGWMTDAYTLYENSGSLDSMAKEVGLDPNKFFTYTAQAEAIVSAVNEKLAAVAPAKKDAGPSQELVLKKTSKSLSGMHSKTVWADQHGNEWMSKGFPNDPNGPARVDAEHYSNVLARLHGFRAPETRVMTLEGKYSYVQLLKPAQGDLTSHTLSSLSDEQLADAMAEHVLDWAVSNHDSNPQNIMIDTDGKVFGIDKGQAFRFFPNDKLAYGYLPPSNPASVFYDQFYAAILSHEITKDRADKIALSVMERAQRMQTRNDKRHRELLGQALANRSTWPEEFSSREKFIDGLMARKSSLLTDFEKLYSGLYKKAGWSWDVDTSQLGKGKLDDHTHVAVTPDLADDVQNSGSHGKALFFNSPDLEDSHILLSIEQDVKGKTVLKGDAKLRKDADAVITAWLKNQLITDNTPDSSSSNSFIPTAANHTALAGTSSIYSALVNAAKTVNTHAEDGQYNADTLAAAEKWQGKLKNALEAVKAWEEKNPEKVYSGDLGLGDGSSKPFVTAEQQAAWKNAAEYYLTSFDQVFQAKAQSLKTYKAFPGSYESPKNQFVVQEYTPSADIDTSGEPKVIGKWVDKYDTLEQWSDGNWLFKAGEGPKKKVGPSLGASIKVGLTPAPLDEPKAEEKKGEAPPQWVFSGGFSYTQMPDGSWKQFKNGKETGSTTSQDMLSALAQTDPNAKLIDGSDQSDEATVTSSTGKTLKVIKRKASGISGQYDPATGITKHQSGELTAPYGGYEYDVENEDASVVVEYRPWSEPGVALSQQGLLRFSVKNWDGSKDQIEDVMDTIQTMGVDLTPADEQSMELFYWRHLYGILQDRADRTDPKWSKTTQHIMDAWKANPDMDPQSELDMLREAWGKSMGSQVVAKADFMPKFGHTNMQKSENGEGFTSGKPHWLRPDFSLSDLQKIYGDSLPSHGISNFNSRILDIVSSGGLYATEERVRLFGSWITGMSSSEDQSKGSAGYLFTRQGYKPGGMSGAQIFLHPKTALRTSNYAFQSDHYGDVEARKNYANFDLKKAAAHSGGSNEMMIKHGASIVDDVAVIMFPSEQLRSEAIARMKAAGITKLHGLPIEQVFVTSEYTAQEAIKAVWGHALAEEKKNGGAS